MNFDVIPQFPKRDQNRFRFQKVRVDFNQSLILFLYSLQILIFYNFRSDILGSVVRISRLDLIFTVQSNFPITISIFAVFTVF